MSDRYPAVAELGAIGSTRPSPSVSVEPAPVGSPLRAPRAVAPTGLSRAAVQALAGPLTQSATALLGHVEQAGQAAIQGARGQITELRRQITQLETTHTNKLAEAEGLGQQIDLRKTELKREYERKRTIGMIGCLFGAPALGLASLIGMQQDDQRLRQLETQKAAAEAAQTAAQGKVKAYQTLKGKLETKLALLEAAAAQLTAAPPPASAHPAHVVRAAGANLNQAEGLLGNLRGQVKLLEALRDSAAELGVQLDGLIAALKVNLEAADKLVEAAQKDTLELIKLAVNKDPQAAAMSFLRKKAASMVRALLKEAGISFDPFIDRLLEGVPKGPLRDQLAGKLRKAFEEAAGFDFFPNPDRRGAGSAVDLEPVLGPSGDTGLPS